MSAPLINLIGRRFGLLVVLELAPKQKGGTRWICSCDCGNTSTQRHGNLTFGSAKSCGCQVRKKTHGHATAENTSPTYSIWAGMIQRCTNSKNKSFHKYGARGISICDEWMDFSEFLNDMGERPSGLSLDRINNNSGYSKENCRWATAKEQSRNQRKSKRWIIHGNCYSTLSDCAAVFGVSTGTIGKRFYRKMPGYKMERLYDKS